MEPFARENGLQPKPIDDDVMHALASRKWPGNVRELKNVVERSAILSRRPRDHRRSARGSAREPVRRRGQRLPGRRDAGAARRDRRRGGERSDPDAAAPRAHGGRHLTLREFREQSERKYIVDTLKMASWNISRTAIVLGVERTNLHKKIRAYEIKRGEG